jgi:hypothetical protein
MTGKTEKEIVKALKRPGALPAFLTAVGILAFLLVQGFLLSLFEALNMIGQMGSADIVGILWARQLGQSLAGPLPFALGVFVAFWQVAPIAPVLRLAHVVTRALLAALLGAVVLWMLSFLWFSVTAVSGQGFSGLGGLALALLWSSLSALVAALPAVVLGAVLLWGWLQRHPPKEAVAGTLDEV